MKNNHFTNFLPEYNITGNEKITKFLVIPSGENFKYFDYNGNQVFLRVEEYKGLVNSNIKIEDIKQLNYSSGQSSYLQQTAWKDSYEVTVIS